MDKKITGVVSYITIIGWIVAYIFGKRDEAKFHMNQAFTLDIIWLILNVLLAVVLAFLKGIPVIGGILCAIVGILGLIPLILAIIGIVYAVNNEEKELPVIGGIKLLH